MDEFYCELHGVYFSRTKAVEERDKIDGNVLVYNMLADSGDPVAILDPDGKIQWLEEDPERVTA
jgi:hypothetical protein